MKSYVAAMAAVDKGARLDDASANAYNAVLVFAAAAKGLSDVTGQKVSDHLSSMGPISTGLRPPTDFGQQPASVKKSFSALARLFDVNVVYEQVKNGVLTSTDGSFHDAITGAAVPFQ
jgi:hypothetical protein